MAQGSRTRRKRVLASSLFTLAAIVFMLFGVYGCEGGDSKYARHMFQLDGGTHVIQIDREAEGGDNAIWFGVTSSWRQGVPSQWQPLGPGAKSIRWTATIDCKNREWTPYNHDTYPYVNGEGDKMGCLLMRPVKQPFSGGGWDMKRPILEYICGPNT
jgi:hypothetical protein